MPDPYPRLNVTVFDESSGIGYYEYNDDNKCCNEKVYNVEDFLQIMFEAYKQMGFVNELEVRIHDLLIRSNEPIHFDPAQGDEPVYEQFEKKYEE